MSAYPTSSAQFRARLLTGCAIAAASMGTAAHAQRAFQATTNNATNYNAFVNQATGRDTVTITGAQAVIDWTPVDNAVGGGAINILAAGDELRFQVDNADALPSYTVLNRINPADPSRAVRIDGLVNSLVDTGYGISDGSIWFYTPGGIILGSNARFDVGSLVLTTNAPQVGDLVSEGLFVGQGTNATAGLISFRGTADSKSFVTVEAGAKINAAGSYVALVAPRVTQGGAIKVNGSAALIAAESADVTIPVEGNLFDIAVFGGSKVDTAGEATLTHTGSTEITDPAQTGNSRRVYMIAVPKNDAITMLVSGTAGYEAASLVSAANGRVILEAGTGVKVTADVVSSEPPVADTTVAMQGLTSTTSVAAGGTFVSLDATSSSSNIGGFLSLNSGAASSITVSNGNIVSVGEGLGGSAVLGVAPSSVTVSAGGTLKIADNLSLSSSIGAAVGSDMTLIADGGTVQVGGSIFVRSVAGGSGGPAGGSTGGNAAIEIRNGGIVTAGSAVSVESTGIGAFGSIGAAGTGGSALIKIESGGSLDASTVTVESAGLGGNGGDGGAGQGGLASLTIDGGTIESGYGTTVRSRGLGGSSSNFGGLGGSGKAGSATISVANAGTITTGTSLALEAFGDGGSESGYGTGGAGQGGTATLAIASGGIITADTLSVSTQGSGAFGQRGGGAGTAGKADIDLTGASSIDANTISLALVGSGGSGGSDGAAAGGTGTGGTLTFDTNGGTLTFDQLNVSAVSSGGSSSSGSGGLGFGGAVKINVVSATMTGGNVISVDAGGVGGEGFSTSGGSGTGGTIGLTFAGTNFTTGGDITLNAKGAGDFGNGGGGSGTGGKIDLAASNSQVQASNINLDSSGFGEQAFSTGSAGFGKGGAITVASTGGGLIKGLNTVRANGRGGSAGGTADTGAGTGGTISIQASGGSIDSTGATLTVSADGIGGRTEFASAADALSRGGTIDIGISTGGELKLTSLKAQANGYFDDQPDGPVLNNGSTGVGGTVRLAMTGGTLTGADIELAANGRGAVSASGGAGGTGYQGRAELSLTGGTATLDSVSVEARAFGGEGFDQQEESGIDPGDGGAAGVGTSPFGGDAGAIVDVSGGSLSAISVDVDGGSTGGSGGDGEEFADVTLTGNGGDAVGGVAVFTTSGTGSVSVASLSVSSIGLGGQGGGEFLFDSSASDTAGGLGGAGTGGLVSVTLGGTGALSLSDILADASGEGGDGGSIVDFFGSQVFGAGTGGQGGAAFGGGANITISTRIEDSPFVTAYASALGGDGGAAPRGGAGGQAIGGSATIAISGGGQASLDSLQAFSDGSGGNGADGASNNGGFGGDGSGGNSTLTVGAGADLEVETLQLYSRGLGGDGGIGADDVSAGFNGGDGGFALGGEAKITANGGRIRVPGGSEASPVSIEVDGTGGAGGSGGSASSGTGGSGGDGGSATGGTATIASADGDIDFFFTALEVNGRGGERGSAGSGLEGVAGDPGFGSGGAIKINVDQRGAPGNSVRLGFGRFNANGGALGEEIASSTAGYIAFDVKGTSSGGALQFDELEANAVALLLPEDRPSGIKVRAEESLITIAGNADLFTTGEIDFAFVGNSGFRAVGDVVLDTSSSVTIAHAGQAPGGNFASIAGREVVVNAIQGFAAAATSRIDATDNLSVTVNGGSATLGSGTVAGSVTVDAAGDVTLGNGAQLIADRSVTFRSGDDIIIGTGALLRAANNPPAETGYGATDPLQQDTQLRLYAGALFQGEGASDDVWSLIINGDVQSPGRIMQLEAQAIQAADGTTLSGGNLYVRKLGITPAVPSDDFGQLAAPCLEGSVCLGNVSFSGVVQIGGSGFAPINLRISGDLIGGSVSAGATNTVRLGRDGVTTTISSLGNLTIDARDGDLLGFGTINLTGGSQVVNLYAGGALNAAGLNVTAPAGFDLVSSSDVILGNVTAPLIRTRDQGLSLVNANGITATGLIQLASIETSSDLLIQSTQSDISVGRINGGGAIDLLAEQGTIAVTTDIQSGSGTTAEARSVTLVGATGLDVLTAKATAGDLNLSTGSGDLSAGISSASGKITLDSAGGVNFASLSAGGELALTAQGAAAGTSLAAGQSASIDADAGIDIASLSVSGPAVLSAVNGDIVIASASASDIAASAQSLDIAGSGSLLMSLAEATAGDAKLSSGGNVTIATLRAAGLATLTAGEGNVNVADLIASSVNASGGSVDLTGSGDLLNVTASAFSGDIRLRAQGRIDATGTAPVSRFDAIGKSVSLTGTGALSVSATATGGDLTLRATGPLTFDQLNATGLADLASKADVTGGSITAGSILIVSPATVKANDLVATAGDLTVLTGKGVTLATVTSTGVTTLKADQGAVTVTSDIRPGQGLVVAAPSIDLTARNGLFVAQADATAGDLKLTTLAGDLIAGKSTAAGAIVLDSAGALSFTSLTAQQGVSVNATGAVAGDTISSKAGAVSVTGTTGISLGSIAAAGPVTLGASAGSILVATDITASGPIQAAAQSISLTAINDLIVDKAQATGGDIVLQSKNGALTIGQADATGTLIATSPGLLTLTGNAAAATIGFTSKDIALGSGAQLGSKTLTNLLTLTSTADRMFIGDATGTGYRLDTVELSRLASKSDIRLNSSPQTSLGSAFNLLDPSGTNIVVGSLTFDGAQLGSTGTLLIASPSSIGFIGNSQFKNFTDGQTVTFAANGDISLAAETGLVTLKNSNGGLAGTLRLQAQQVHAMSTATRSAIAGLELNAVKQRLGTNDQVNNQGGYFQAGNIVVNIGRLLFIQNSGANGDDVGLRAGLSANNLTISSGEGGPVQVILNGQVNGATGTALRDNVTLNGQIDPGSAFNGCAIGEASCGSAPPPEPVFDSSPVVSSARDQIEDEEEEDEKEQALQASQTRPDPIIQFMTPPSSRFDPLIDEPVTGAGNEDLWETPLVPSPGQNP